MILCRTIQNAMGKQQFNSHASVIYEVWSWIPRLPIKVAGLCQTVLQFCFLPFIYSQPSLRYEHRAPSEAFACRDVEFSTSPGCAIFNLELKLHILHIKYFFHVRKISIIGQTKITRPHWKFVRNWIILLDTFKRWRRLIRCFLSIQYFYTDSFHEIHHVHTNTMRLGRCLIHFRSEIEPTLQEKHFKNSACKNIPNQKPEHILILHIKYAVSQSVIKIFQN